MVAPNEIIEIILENKKDKIWKTTWTEKKGNSSVNLSRKPTKGKPGRMCSRPNQADVWDEGWIDAFQTGSRPTFERFYNPSNTNHTEDDTLFLPKVFRLSLLCSSTPVKKAKIIKRIKKKCIHDIHSIPSDWLWHTVWQCSRDNKILVCDFGGENKVSRGTPVEKRHFCPDFLKVWCDEE